jgi:rsbT co-antagonist protein RsbR
MSVKTAIGQFVNSHKDSILASWEKEQKASIRAELIKPTELKEQSKEFLALFLTGLETGSLNATGAEWSQVRDFLSSLSYSRGIQGFTPTETALFVFALKRSLMEHAKDTSAVTGLWDLMNLLDKFGLFTTEVYQKAREEVINRQQTDMLELSTPVVELAEGIIALPMIGTLDSSRTSIVMETLLQRIVDTEASIAIIDITGVPTVDTLVAQHLLKTVTAARLMGAECIISGIRPQIAATIVHLGVDLGAVVTKASLASAFNLALKKMGHVIIKASNNKA